MPCQSLVVSRQRCTAGRVSHSSKDHTWSAKPAAIAGVRGCQRPSEPFPRIRVADLSVAEDLTPEQEALIAGAGLRSFRPTLEPLETREVMSANFGEAPVVPPANNTFERRFPRSGNR